MGNQNKDLYREAVADAKKVRDAAIANAKMALEETITPRIQEMLRKKLSEEEDKTMDEADGSGQGADNLSGSVGSNEMTDSKTVAEGEEVTEETLDEILAELQNEETLEEAAVEEKKGEESEEETEETGEEETGEEEGEGDDTAAQVDPMMGDDSMQGEPQDDQEVVELSVGELKDVIASTLMSLGVGADQAAMDATPLEPETAATGDEMPMQTPQDEEEPSLDEVLASLDETDAPVAEQKVEEEKGKTVPAGTGMKGGQKPMKSASAGGVKSPGKLQTKQFFEKKGVSGSTYTKNVSTKNGSLAEELKKAHQDLIKSHKVIKHLVSEMNGMNLINAKLLYANKIFKQKTLNESQKAKILTSFDSLTSIKDVKRLYETLAKTTFNKTIGKKPLKESLGFASKPVGKAPAAPIVAENDVVTRMQELAGIIKRK